MFARASSKSYVCLQCQHRLAFREAWTQNPVWKRWQTASAVAHQQEKDDDDHDPHIHYVTEPPEKGGMRTRYRHWQPPPTVELGVNVLGKPAEVLVLPQEPRKKQRHKERMRALEGLDAEEDAPRTPAQLSVREALAEERKPASPSEAIANIERMRLEIGEPIQPLPKEARLKYQNALTSGFSKNQLQRYMMQKGVKQDERMILNISSKKAIAAIIIDEIWGLHYASAEMGSGKSATAYIPVTNEKYELLCLTRRYDACSSAFIDTKLTYDPRNARICVSGKDSDIDRIKNILGPQSTTVTKSLRLRPILNQAFTVGTIDHYRLQEIMRRHGVLLKRTTGSWNFRCLAFSDTNLQRFEREIIHWQAEKGMAASQVPPLFYDPVESSNHDPAMPVYTSRPEESLRYLSSISTNDDGLPSTARSQGDDKFDQVLGNLQQALQAGTAPHPGHDIMPVDYPMLEHFSSEYSVELGQATFQQNKTDEALVDLTARQPSTTSFFLSRIPLLSQFLAQQQHTGASLPSMANDVTNSDTDTRIVRITLQSASPKTHPSIEILAKSRGYPTPSLEIQGVTLLFNQLSQTLLLPSTPVDLKLCRSDKFALLGANTPIEQRYAPLLAQIAEQLVISDTVTAQDEKPHAKARIEERLRLLLDLDLSCLQRSSDEKVSLTQNQTQGKISTFNRDSAETKARSKARASTGVQSKVRYALDRVEAVDSAVYNLPSSITHASTINAGRTENKPDSIALDLQLEHLILTPRDSTYDHNRTEILRVIERPMLHIVARKPERESSTIGESPEENGTQVKASQPTKSIGCDSDRFNRFVKSAYETAMALDAFVRKRSKEMVEAHKLPG